MAKVDKRASRSVKARTRARAIYISLTKSANGEAPTDRKIVEHLAREGLDYTVSMIAQWRKADGWADEHDPALSPVRLTYEVDGNPMTYEANLLPAETESLGEGHRRSHLKMRKLLDDWLDGTCRKDLTVAEAFKLFEMLAKDRETAESCDIRLDEHRAAIAKDVTPPAGIVDNDASNERERTIRIRDHFANMRQQFAAAS